MIRTIGHGARPVEDLVAILVGAGVETLVDVRRFPGSRRHPQFGRDAIAATLRSAGLQFTWEGEALGGRRQRQPNSRHTALRNASFAAYADHMDTPEFRTAVDQLTAGSAVMCAETLWWRCHRMLIADALVLRGVTVEHLLEVGKSQPHRVTEGARLGSDGWPVYDGQQTLPGL